MLFNLNEKVNETKHEEKMKKITEAKASKKPILTMEEAWTKIRGMKNSEADRVKLKEVFQAMQDGTIGREIGNENKSFSKAEALRLYRVLQDSQREQKLEEMVTNTPANYILVTTSKQGFEMVKDLYNEPIIAVDSETTGVQVYKDKLVGVSFTAPTLDKHWYIPLWHDELVLGVTEKSLLENCIMKVLSMNNEKVFHNAIFDLHIFRNHGFTVNGKVHDTMIRQHILNENEMSYALKNVVSKYFPNMPSDTFAELFGKDCKFNTVPLKYARYYACKDTHITWLLYQFQQKHLEHQPKLLNYYTEVEQPLIRVVERMEAEGFYVDMDEVARQEKYLTTRLEELEINLKKELGDINFKSPIQLMGALSKYTGETIISTASKELKQFNHYSIIKDLIEFKDLTKQLTGFVRQIPTMIQPDGKLHGSFSQMGTVTGRFSSRNPNLQQQSKPARNMFRVDENSLIVGADFSGQELRMLAHLTQDPFLLDIYHTGKDFYSMIASKVFKLPIEQCGNDTKPRKQAKVVVLGLIYGMATPTLASNLGIEKKEAEQIVEDFFANFTFVKSWMDANIKFCKKSGFVEMMDGRKRRLPDIKTKDWGTYGRAERQCKANAIIQGSSSVQTKRVMIELDKWCLEQQKLGRDIALNSTIHDELLIRVPKDVTEVELKQIESIMINTLPLSVPSKTDIELGNCWGKMVGIKEVFPQWEVQNG
jgi:DNA polymerase I - 3''-5'' exonuclease and polymerase domains